jgi:hypothetical protein
MPMRYRWEPWLCTNEGFGNCGHGTNRPYPKKTVPAGGRNGLARSLHWKTLSMNSTGNSASVNFCILGQKRARAWKATGTRGLRQ